MDIGKSLTFVFDDERWISKLAIAAGVLLLGIVGIVIVIGPILASAILMGYMIAIARNVMRGDEHPLPDWSGIGEMFVDGLKLIVAQILWAGPFILFAIPFIAVSAIADESGSGEGIAAILGICVACVGFLYTILFMLITPALTVRIAETGSLGDAMSLRGVLHFTRENLAHVIVVLLMIAIAQMLAGFVGSLLCGVGLFVTLPWAYMVQGHLSGQLAIAGGATGYDGTTYPAPPYDEPMPPVPADLPDDREIVGEIRQQAEQVQSDWDDQAVRIDEPSEPLVWDDAPAQTDAAPSIPTKPDVPTEPEALPEPAEPDVPAEPSVPSEPAEPDVWAEPSVPSEPTEPDVWAEPSVPTEPAEPDVPVDMPERRDPWAPSDPEPPI